MVIKKARIRSMIPTPDNKLHTNLKTSSGHPTSASIFMKYAAAIALILSTVAYYFIKSGQVESAPVKASGLVTKFNPSGQKSQLQLPDGSVAYLNSESSLKYNEEFKEGRVVEVNGEVKRDSVNPFKVKANHLEVTALGTSFNVKAFPRENETEISLLSGLLLVEDRLNGNSATLYPGEAANSGIPGQRIQKSVFTTESVIYWTKGIIHFDSTNIIEAIDFLEKWYGVNIAVKNLPPRPITCTGKYTNENLENILNILGFSIGFEYEIRGKTVEIIFN